MTKIAAVLMAAMLIGADATAPAQSQSLDFGIFFGDERSDFYPERISCLTDNQIRNAIADLGYTNVALNVANDKHIQVRATRGGWVYLLDFNYCTAQIEGRQRLRAAN